MRTRGVFLESGLAVGPPAGVPLVQALPRDPGLGGQALNAADGSFAEQLSPTDPMSLVAKAAVNSHRMLVGISPSAAKTIWTTMIENGENGRYCYDMWRTGDI